MLFFTSLLIFTSSLIFTSLLKGLLPKMKRNLDSFFLPDDLEGNFMSCPNETPSSPGLSLSLDQHRVTV